jgi:hypothetical protein
MITSKKRGSGLPADFGPKHVKIDCHMHLPDVHVCNKKRHSYKKKLLRVNN